METLLAVAYIKWELISLNKENKPRGKQCREVINDPQVYAALQLTIWSPVAVSIVFVVQNSSYDSHISGGRVEGGMGMKRQSIYVHCF